MLSKSNSETESFLSVVATILDAEVITEGWDTPPAGTAVKKNPNPPPKFIPADVN